MSNIKKYVLPIAITITMFFMPLKAMAATTESQREISLNSSKYELKVGETKVIEATTKPTNESKKGIEFISVSNIENAKVEKITKGLNVEAGGKLTAGNKVYYIQTKVNEKALSVDGEKTNNSTNIVVQKNQKKDSQKFELIDAGNGYFIIRIKHSGKVLDLQGGKKENSTKVIQYKLTGNDNQLWKLEDAGNGYYYIKSKHSGLYLDIQGGKANDGDKIIVYQKNSKNNQKFRFVDTGEKAKVEEFGLGKITGLKGGYSYLKATWNEVESEVSSIIVNDIEFRMKDTTLYVNQPAIIEAVLCGETFSNVSFSSSNNSIATVEKAKVSGPYYFRTAINNRVLSAETSNSSKTLIVDELIENYFKSNHQFDLVDAGNGYYIIRANNSETVLDVQGNKKESGTKVIHYNYTGKDNQLWKLEDAGNGYYYIKSKSSGLYLEVNGGKANVGDTLIINNGNKKASQKFRFEAMEKDIGYKDWHMAKIVPKKAGKVKITATSSSGVTKSFEITVKK